MGTLGSGAATAILTGLPASALGIAGRVIEGRQRIAEYASPIAVRGEHLRRAVAHARVRHPSARPRSISASRIPPGPAWEIGNSLASGLGQHGTSAPTSLEDTYEDRPASAISAVPVTRRVQHPGCGADGVHGPWRRTVAARRRAVHRPGVVRLQLQLRGQQASLNPPTGRLHIELSYTDHGSNPLGSSFSIHGTVDTIDPVLESEICIGQNPPPGGNELIFLGRYRLTSSAPAGFPSTCPARETTTTPLCRFEVIVRDNDKNRAPSTGDYFQITLSSGTALTQRARPRDRVLHPGRPALERQPHGRLALSLIARSTREETEQ